MILPLQQLHGKEQPSMWHYVLMCH